MRKIRLSDKVKLNHMYLWYSVVLLFVPLHELGHVIIAWCIGEKITAMHWNYITVVPNHLDFIQDLWQYSPAIPPICAILFLYLFIKENHITLNDLKSKKVVSA